MPNEVSWGEFVFPSQQAARRECERRLLKYGHKDFLQNGDRHFFITLFEDRLPNFIENFYGSEDPDLCDKPSLQRIHWNEFSERTPFAHWGLRAIREDGSWAPLSYRLATDTGSHRSWVQAAARRIVAPQANGFLSRWKARNGNVSALSGPTTEPLTHRYLGTSFGDLLNRWMKAENLSFSDITTVVDGKNSVTFRDTALVESWAAFHRGAAAMDAVTSIEYYTAKPTDVGYPYA